jgi:signal transduction histidine kinase
MANIDDGKPAALGDVDVAELVRTELALLAPAALARHIDLVLDAPDTLRWRLDLHAFQAVLHNLVNNAIAYIPAHGRVHVGLRGDGAALVLAVADDGPGIPPAERALVFERFYRGAGHDKPGAGLGLAIVREAAARLGGGVVLVEGIDGKGCRFVVTIPSETHHA